MKYRKTIIIVILAIIVAVSPYFSGQLAEKRIRFMVAKVIKLTRQKFKLKQYQINWLSTQLTFTTTTGKLFVISIKHGPIISTSQGFKLASAYVDYSEKELRALFPDSNILWSNDATVKIKFPFVGNSIFAIKAESLKVDYTFSPEIFQFIQVFRLKFSKIDFLIPISIDGQIKGAELNFKGAKGKVNDVNINLNEFGYKSHHKLPFNGLKMGADKIRLERLELSTASNIGLVIKELSYSFVADVVGALVQYKITLKTGQLEINKHKIKRLLYAFTLSNLDDHALIDLSKMEDRVYRMLVKSDIPGIEILVEKALTRFFSTSPVAKSSLDINFVSGNLNILISAGSKPALFKGAAHNFTSVLIKNGHLDVKASADKRAFFEMLQILQELKGVENLSRAIDISTIASSLIGGSFIDIRIRREQNTEGDAGGSGDNVTIVLKSDTLSTQERINLSVRKTIAKYLSTKVIIERDNKYQSSLDFKHGVLLLNGQKNQTSSISE